MSAPTSKQPEPWLRGTLTDVKPVQRAVLHALELAREDLSRWCGELRDAELDARPAGLPSVAQHVRHICGSIDRLLTYAENRMLSEQQLAALKSEQEPGAAREELFRQLSDTLVTASDRIRAFDPAAFGTQRYVGKLQLPTTLGGLLVHVADHTQRHVGQAVTTAKLLLSQRER